MKEINDIKISFESFHPTLITQLEAQNIEYEGHVLSIFEDDRRSVNRLRSRGIIGAHVCYKAYSNIRKHLLTHVTKINETKEKIENDNTN